MTMTMTMAITTNERIIEKAWGDSAFKAALLANPRTALKQHFDIELPERMEVVVAEETPGRLLLVIPPNPSAYAQEADAAEETW